MDIQSILTILIPTLGTFLGIYVSNHLSYKGVVKKTELEGRDDIYSSWKDLYDTQKQANEDLKTELVALKLDIKSLRDELDILEKDNRKLLDENIYLKERL